MIDRPCPRASLGFQSKSSRRDPAKAAAARHHRAAEAATNCAAPRARPNADALGWSPPNARLLLLLNLISRIRCNAAADPMPAASLHSPLPTLASIDPCGCRRRLALSWLGVLGVVWTSRLGVKREPPPPRVDCAHQRARKPKRQQEAKSQQEGCWPLVLDPARGGYFEYLPMTGSKHHAPVAIGPIDRLRGCWSPPGNFCLIISHAPTHRHTHASRPTPCGSRGAKPRGGGGWSKTAAAAAATMEDATGSSTMRIPSPPASDYDDTEQRRRRSGEQPRERRRRRKQSPALLALVLLGTALLLAYAAVGARAAAAAGKQKQKGAGQGKEGKGGKRKAVVSLTSEELLEHLEFWSTDVALFFYAPWCPYCKCVRPFFGLVGLGVGSWLVGGLVGPRQGGGFWVAVVAVTTYHAIDLTPPPPPMCVPTPPTLLFPNRLVGPYWDMVGEWHLEQQSKDLLMARFDCERCGGLAFTLCCVLERTLSVAS
jgi:hypothetical protein